ncbi:hypothetical protein [Saliphagus infecundisoli]|uniref:N-acetyltransferase domain-containing protein n=1 Tax=Saliphagus infecundisoli TaxID=1849069 RepID=A0ABD5QK39_9EURY|nr:hypothetical protein [Saliphagus infecundisoli]
MHVREAVEADAPALAAVAGSPADVMRNLVHDRTVRVAEPDDPDRGSDPSGDADDDRELLGFVSFDADAGTVHVTGIDGTEAACERLLAEPIEFAAGESMAVETLLPPDSPAIGAVDRLGFEEAGAGPRFDGDPTIRYRLESAADARDPET